MKHISIMTIFLFVTSFQLLMDLGAQENANDPIPSKAKSDAEISSSEALTLELLDGTKDEWKLINQQGDLLGFVKSRQQETFKIYDSNTNYLGFVYESENWVPKGARQKRELKISTADIKLYLDILKAVGSTSVESQNLKLSPKNDVHDEWTLLNQNGDIAGSVKKAEISFKFYDSDNRFMGFIYPSGFWMPKLGLNRREMKITPDQARFSLDVFKAVESIK